MTALATTAALARWLGALIVIGGQFVFVWPAA